MAINFHLNLIKNYLYANELYYTFWNCMKLCATVHVRIEPPLIRLHIAHPQFIHIIYIYAKSTTSSL